MAEKVPSKYMTQPFDGLRLFGVCHGSYLAKALKKAAEETTDSMVRASLYSLASRAYRHASNASTSKTATASWLEDAEAMMKKVTGA